MSSFRLILCSIFRPNFDFNGFYCAVLPLSFFLPLTYSRMNFGKYETTELLTIGHRHSNLQLPSDRNTKIFIQIERDLITSAPRTFLFIKFIADNFSKLARSIQYEPINMGTLIEFQHMWNISVLISVHRSEANRIKWKRMVIKNCIISLWTYLLNNWQGF